MAPLSTAKWHQLLAAIPVIYIKFSMGLATGWLAPTLSIIRLTIYEISLLASIHELGRFFGALMTASLTDVIGRKITLIFSALVSFFIWFGVLSADRTSLLYIIRFMFGIGAGICDVVSPIYLTENYSSTSKATFDNISTTFYYFGIFIQFVLLSYLPYSAVTVINLMNGSLCVLCTLFLKEPIQHLITKGRITDAQKTFAWLKGEDDRSVISTEFETIRTDTEDENERKITLKNLFSDTINRKKIIIVIITNALIMGTGWGAITAYWTILLPSTESVTSYTSTVCIGFVQMLAAVIWLIIFNQYNENHRRFTIAIGLLIIGPAQCWMALKYTSSGYWRTFFIMAYLAFGYVPLNSFAQITGEQFFPRNTKSNSIAVMAQSIVGFLTTALFSLISSSWAIQVNFVIYSIVSFATLIYLAYTFPKPALTHSRADRNDDFARRYDCCLTCGIECSQLFAHCLCV